MTNLWQINAKFKNKSMTWHCERGGEAAERAKSQRSEVFEPDSISHGKALELLAQSYWVYWVACALIEFEGLTDTRMSTPSIWIMSEGVLVALCGERGGVAAERAKSPCSEVWNLTPFLMEKLSRFLLNHIESIEPHVLSFNLKV